MKYQIAIAICIILAILLSGCAARPCPPLPEMGETQTLTDYTVNVVNLYNVCRGDVNATR